MITLGIETSCDETAIALLETKEKGGVFEYRVISSLIHSQADLHSQYGGVFPALAKREHGKNLIPLLKKILEDSKIEISNKIEDRIFEEKLKKIKDDFGDKNPDLIDSLVSVQFLKDVPKIDRIAITEGPGLEPALWVGISFAEILSSLWSIPLFPVNHMEGHILGSLLNKEDNTWSKLKTLDLPALALLISGGHTEIIKIDSDKNNSSNILSLNYSIIGQTKDDALGEAFDKVARLLNLPYPGGPHVSRLASECDNKRLNFSLPRPMINSKDLDFSFSGLKTAVLYAVKNQEKEGPLSDDWKRSICREFEEAVEETLVSKLKKAIETTNAKTIVVGGGVIANKTLRQSLEKLATEYQLPIYLPSKHVSGDNALMIALSGAICNKSYDRKLKADGTKRLSTEVVPQ